jgi:hypothetical protein
MSPDAKEIVVFNPAGVKSVFNEGTWSLETKNLLKQPVKLKPGPNSPGVGIASENKLGFWKDLRVKVLGKLELPKKSLILTGTNNKNAQKQIDSLDEILNKFPSTNILAIISVPDNKAIVLFLSSIWSLHILQTSSLEGKVELNLHILQRPFRYLLFNLLTKKILFIFIYK